MVLVTLSPLPFVAILLLKYSSDVATQFVIGACAMYSLLVIAVARAELRRHG
jgi:hypothetical protein